MLTKDQIDTLVLIGKRRLMAALFFG